jgi:hypothetical protein
MFHIFLLGKAKQFLATSLPFLNNTNEGMD